MFDMISTPESTFTAEQAISQSQTKFGIGILICTYNPDEQIFHRTLKSVALLTIPTDVPVECIIIDNNSPTPVNQLEYVREFLGSCPWARVIQESQQGLTFARIAGFKAANNSFIVFIDDDNEVSSNYLEALVDLFVKYPSVAAWGPGNINVEFLGNVSEWFSNNFKLLFQERHSKHNVYGCVPGTWPYFYPFGTGLAVRREIFEQYCAEVEKGNLCSSDRKGKSLSSGGDNQIVWEAIKMGYAAGIGAALVVNHLIPSSRCNLDYVKRLRFGTADSYIQCMVNSFPELKSSVIATMPSSFSIILKVTGKTIKHFTTLKFRGLAINLAGYLGDVSSHYKVAGKTNVILDFLIKKLKLN
jgi:glycosyltransferase involved in cell wall biosynthesis